MHIVVIVHDTSQKCAGDERLTRYRFEKTGHFIQIKMNKFFFYLDIKVEKQDWKIALRHKYTRLILYRETDQEYFLFFW